MDGKVFGRKRSRPWSKHYPRISPYLTWWTECRQPVNTSECMLPAVRVSSARNPLRLLSLSLLPFLRPYHPSWYVFFLQFHVLMRWGKQLWERERVSTGVEIVFISLSVCSNEPNLWGVQKWQCKERSKPSTIPLVIKIPQLGTSRLHAPYHTRAVFICLSSHILVHYDKFHL
jgi:hypothetical protein